ncbi:phosphoribosylformylglycinamidine synthase-associated small membrane protein [Pseudovibrio sp. SPO723]|nr:phosphoribosylformylglycinamidine synthase-associated small membrane protein [Pseudovibrio sp. SPO723]MDX5594671.1 phosphoribosylformylglycinamidine synthase-associated small membrane protein [Pseudovibrio sp. SPO723]
MQDTSKAQQDDTRKIVRFLAIKAAVFILLPMLLSLLAVFILL